VKKNSQRRHLIVNLLYSFRKSESLNIMASAYHNLYWNLDQKLQFLRMRSTSTAQYKYCKKH